MTSAWRRLVLVTVAMLSFVLMPSYAMAADLYCNADGSVGQAYVVDNSGNRAYLVNPDGSPQMSELFPTYTQGGPCGNFDYSQPGLIQITQRIFSWIMCNYILILNYVLGAFYCGMQISLTQILTVVFTAYVAIFGAQIMLGIVKINMGDVIMRLLKIALIFMFVTQAEWGIGLAFNFFINLATEGIVWVLDGITTATGFSLGGNGGMINVYSFFDQLVYNVTIGPFTQSNSMLMGFFLAISLVVPPVFLLVAYWLWETFLIVARSMITFMLAISAMAFLITLSPIFLSLMLFQVTRHFFEDWVKFMISYTLQVIVIFACIAMWLAVTSYFINFFNDLTTIIRPFQKAETIGVATDIKDSWGVCIYTFVDTYDEFLNLGGGKAENIYRGPHITCMPGDDRIIPMTKIPEEQSLIYYLFYHLVTLVLITYAFSVLIKQAPSLAKQLAGPSYSPTLGQNQGFNHYGQFKNAIGQGKSSTPESKAREYATHEKSAIRQFMEQSKQALTGRNSEPKKT